jgi:hypothetical protein
MLSFGGVDVSFYNALVLVYIFVFTFSITVSPFKASLVSGVDVCFTIDFGYFIDSVEFSDFSMSCPDF